VTKLALMSTDETVWSGKPGTEKALAWSQPVPLEEVKAIGRAMGATLNDVLLASISAGLQRYLTEQHAHLEEVAWMVPVNLKPFEDNLPPDLGNYFALVFLPMPLEAEDAASRVDMMHHRMQRIKNSDEAVLTFGLQRVVSMSPSQIAFFLTNFFANKAVGVLTNVPGPTGLLRYAGVDVEQVVGFAPCSGDQPMTATIFSYNGTVTIGFATDAGLLPEPDRLLGYVMEELESLRASVV
jgi:diacylglycerol O-acyltransferase